MVPDRNYENHYNELKLIIGKIVSNVQDFEMLLVMVWTTINLSNMTNIL